MGIHTRQNAPTTNEASGGALKNGVTTPGKMLDEQRMMDQKESFVRTVFTARQQCEEFKNTIRQKEEHAVLGRNFENKNASLKQQTSEQNTVESKHESNNTATEAIKASAQQMMKKPQQSSGFGSNIRQLNRNVDQDAQFFVTENFGPRKSSPVSKNPLSYSQDVQEMAADH